MTTTPTKETALRLVIENFGAANRANITEMIETLNFKIGNILNPNSQFDEVYIEMNIVMIGFLYSALRDMEFHSNDLPFNLN